MTAAQLITIMESAVQQRCRVTVSPDGTSTFTPIATSPSLAAHILFNANLSAPRKITLISLAVLAHGRAQCQTSINTLSFMTGCCPRTVAQNLSDLEQIGHIQILRQSGRRNTYVLTVNTGGIAE